MPTPPKTLDAVTTNALHRRCEEAGGRRCAEVRRKGPLSRESFTQALAAGNAKGGVFGPANYNGGSRFGGSTAYANEADCTNRLSNTVGVYSR